ncbi:MAG: response regulator [Terracidiphilus sp.]|jgi:DNA-binding NtrC family response regulator
MEQTPAHTRVFVVDDEANIASSLATILRIHGFDARAFTEPLAALSAARFETPDLLISDVIMPVLSGIDLAIQMQRNYPKCRVLLFSGQAGNSDMLQAARDDGHNFELLSKPVHPKVLLDMIKKVST